ncbi:MAG: dipeptide ABC transporter ATP-binding protein [Gammaproteobacteria bacterium]|nr:dipeptide ABC transporter ATP-binding protein [Gammaproteobacteria bacterium]
MTIPLLKVSNLHTQFGTGDNAVKAVDGIDFTINKGETFVLLGESGCGKSVTALSIIRLLPSAARIMEGSIHLYDQNLFELPEFELRKIRGNRIAMIFQEPQSSLNPVLTAGQQIGETLKQHKGIRGRAQRRQVIELLDAVGIPQPQQRIDEYPHQFSGGMKQRIMIAIALAGEPELLIADEPTTALDVTIQAQVLELLQQLQKNTGMAMLFITHDLGVASNIADHIGVMYNGKIVEKKSCKEFFSGHEHPYSQQLFDALPSKEKRNREAMGKPQRHKRQAVPILRVSDLKVHFPIKKGLFKRIVGYVRAVDGVSLEISSGETVAVVGESGSGKTTMGKGILQLFRPTEGSVVFEGEELTTMSDKELRSRRSDIQIIFQDPYSSMNPRMMIVDIIEEGMIAQGIGKDKKERLQKVDELLQQVGLETAYKFRYPHEFSGGQRQRICIARALAVEPKLIICDEPTSSLDVSVQSHILELLNELQEKLGLAYLFITHNISVVEYLAHFVAVMYQGKIVEQGLVDEVLYNPQHAYTRELLSAVPRIKTGTDN